MALSEKLAVIGARLVPENVRHAAWLRPRYPLVGIEVRDDALVAARVARRGSGWRLAGHGRIALRPGIFSASLSEPGEIDAPAFARAVGDVLRLAGAEKAGRISIAVPDTAVRVTLVDLAELPASRAQAEEVIRFRIRKSVPFRPEDSRLTWDVLGHGEDGRVQVVVAIAPDAALRPIEEALHGAGVRCGLVDLATFDLFNALRLEGRFGAAAAHEVDNGDGAGGDLALVNATPSYFSVIIVRGARMIFYRSKGYHAQGGYLGEESLRVVGRELRSTLGYYEEHLLGSAIRRAYVRATGVPGDEIADIVRAAGIADVRRATVERTIPELAQMPEEAAADLLPAVGLALRRHA